MEFGFNHITDNAIRAMDLHGIKYRRLSEDTWKVYTASFDMVEEKFRERGIRPDNPEREKMYYAQGVRVLKTESGMYVYLIQDVVFYAYNKVTKDFSTYPPTQFVDTILEVMPPDRQDSWRDRLLSIRTLADPNQPFI